MKASKIFLTMLFFLGLSISSHANAHFLYMDPIGTKSVSAGDEVGLEVYLHATEGDGLSFYVLDLGFDGSELTYSSVDYGNDEMIPYFYTMTVEENLLHNIARDTPMGSTLTLTEGEDKLLFTAYFTFTDGLLDGQDAWVKFDPMYSLFGFDSGMLQSLDVYTDNAGTTLLGDNGPDYGTAAVPIPAAFWLLGSGIAALVGIRRRNA